VIEVQRATMSDAANVSHGRLGKKKTSQRLVIMEDSSLVTSTRVVGFLFLCCCASIFGGPFHHLRRDCNATTKAVSHEAYIIAYRTAYSKAASHSVGVTSQARGQYRVDASEICSCGPFLRKPQRASPQGKDSNPPEPDRSYRLLQ
jgi:hypothetical protein